MQVIKSVTVLLLVIWVIIMTVAAVSMPPLEHKMLSWSIAAFGPVVLTAGLWEVCSRVFGGRGK